MNKNKALLYLTAIVLLIMSLSTALSTANTTETFTITGTTIQYTLYLPAGTTFNGSIAATGLVRVWVNDENSTIIANLGIIDKNATLNFAATNQGSYNINLENGLPSTIQVTLSYVTDPELQNNDMPLLQIIYLTILGVVTVVGVILIIRSSRKTKKNPTEAGNSMLKTLQWML